MKSSCVACFNSECRLYTQKSLLLISNSDSVLSLFLMSCWRWEAMWHPLLAGFVWKAFSILSLPHHHHHHCLLYESVALCFTCLRHIMKCPTRPPLPWPNSCPFTKSVPLPQARLIQLLLMVSCSAVSYAFKAQVLLCCEILAFLIILLMHPLTSP